MGKCQKARDHRHTKNRQGCTGGGVEGEGTGFHTIQNCPYNAQCLGQGWGRQCQLRNWEHWEGQGRLAWVGPVRQGWLSGEGWAGGNLGATVGKGLEGSNAWECLGGQEPPGRGMQAGWGVFGAGGSVWARVGKKGQR